MKRSRSEESIQKQETEVKRIKLASNNEAVKILVVGDVNGNFHTVFSKVSQVNQQHGPFSALFCVGCFFGTQPTLSEEDEAYLKGDAEIPIPTYFIDAKSHTELASQYLSESDEGKELTNNLHFLGNYGYKTLHNLSVAYISGSENESPHFKKETLDSWITSLPQPTCDLLLTCDWAHNIQLNLNKEDRAHPPQYIDFRTMGSKLLSQPVLQHLFPKYHFCAQQGFYFERLPYKSQVNENQIYFTRFIALASVPKTTAEASKDKLFKYIYAANITPLSATNSTPLSSVPKFTDNPFTIKTKRVVTDEMIQAVRKKYAVHSNPKETAAVAENCWFCLSNPKLEKHLLVHIGEDLYLSLPKGSVSSDTLMIIPITHMQSVIQFTDAMWKELEILLNQVLKPVFAKENKNILLIERFIYSNRVPVHCYLNVVPIDATISSDEIATKFETMGKEKGIGFTVIKEESENLCQEFVSSLMEARCEHDSYIWTKLPDGRKLVHRITDFRTCSNFAREVCIALLNSEAELHWRDSTATVEQETELCEKMKAKLKEYIG